MTSDQARARAHELLFPVEYSVQHEGVAAEIARLESERDAARRERDGYHDTYSAVLAERDAALRERDEARGERDRYLREVALQRNALQDIAGKALFCRGTCQHWAGDRAIGPAHKAKETLERTDRESWEAAESLVSALSRAERAEAALARDNHALADAREEVGRLRHAFMLPSMCPSELCSFGDDGQCVAWRFHEHATTQLRQAGK
jgi:hypothetical protein